MARNMQVTHEAIRILEEVLKCSSYEGVKQLSAQIETQNIRESKRIKCDNILSLDELERNVEGLIERVKELVLQGKSKVVDSSSTRGYLLMPTNLAGETTTHKTLRRIWDCLMADGVRKIGVYGMGGIGKTAIMKHINNCILEDKNGKFDKVIWVTVSKTPNIVKLQNDIAQQLGFDLSKDEDMTIRVSILYNALQGRRRYVLILDDMWEGIHLPKIGIPEPTVENECKLVLTTRTLDVCNFMKADKNIQVGCLSEEEALNLFLDHVGRDILHVQGLEPIVKDVSRKCACLPLAIVIVASNMAGKREECEWKKARRELGSNSYNNAQEVIEQLRYSYESLKSGKLQDCLLYCALYPEDYEIPIESVIELLIDVGIIDEDVGTRKDQSDEAHCMFITLKNVCFLEGQGSEKFAKMHDLVRDMALQIASDRFMVEAGLGSNELPKEKNWSKNLMEVSLMKNNIKEFPSNVSPECPKLSVLLLQENPLSKVIPNSFFEHMLGLKVLNLSGTRIDILPNSVSNLVNLKALILRWCYELRHVPSLAMMKNLRRLDLAHSYKLDELPQGLEELTNLKYLDLHGVDLEIPHGILSKLSQLQYLVTTGGMVMKEELMRLKKLEYFRGRLLNIKGFNEFFKHINLEGGLVDYNIAVGISFIPLDYHKCVSLGDMCNICKSGDLPMLPKDIRHLTIQFNNSISSLCENVLSSGVMR